MAEYCYHCGLALSADNYFMATVSDKTRSFCCFACQSVCEAIHGAGLESFYAKTAEGVILNTSFDSEPFLFDKDDDEKGLTDLITEQGDVKTIYLLVEGIQCAACTWLIEQTLSATKGVVSADVNLTNKRVKIDWDSRICTLATILRVLKEVGYAAVPYEHAATKAIQDKQQRNLLYRMAFAGFSALNMMWISIALYSGAAQGEFAGWFFWLCFFIATPTLFYSGYPLLANATAGLLHRRLTMDLPIALGATVTYGYSCYALFSAASGHPIYFDTVVNFLFIILLGRYLEARAKHHALRATHRLVELQPRLATLVKEHTTQRVPIHRVKKYDHIMVKPGQKVPVDGVIREGQSTVDEAMLSGESNPIIKRQGDSVYAGSINHEGAFVVEVQATQNNTALAKIIRLMEDAQASKAPIQTLADRIVPWFVGTTLLLATLTFVLWSQIDNEKALMAAISVLIITCPCALGLATPMSVAVAIGEAAKRGIMIKQGAALEQLSRINHLVFDKTATLTEGKLHVVRVVTAEAYSNKQVIALAASAEQASQHSIAQAIVKEAQQLGCSLQATSDFMSFPGQGIKVRVASQDVMVGTMSWLQNEGIVFSPEWLNRLEEEENTGLSHAFVVLNKQIIALITLQDKLRKDALATLHTLQKERLTTSVLSGDREATVKRVLKDVRHTAIQAEVLPAGKIARIRRLQQEGECVAMIGDGVNDSPALVQADVGIALAGGTDVSVANADIVLMKNKLVDVFYVKKLADKTMEVIRQNLVLSISYNVVFVPLAMFAFLNPLLAAVSMPISSLLVIANTMRIKTIFKEP